MTIKKQWVGIILVMIMMTACTSLKHQVTLEEVILKDNVEIGVSEDTRTTIIEYMEGLGIEGDFDKDLICVMTDYSHEAVDLVHVMIEDTTVDGFVIIRNNEIVAMLGGIYYSKLYHTDLNDDGEKELLYQSTFGSGMLYLKFMVYDLENSSDYGIAFYNNNENVVLEKEEDGIYVHTYYSGFDKVAEAPLGKLILRDEALIIEGYDDDLQNMKIDVVKEK